LALAVAGVAVPASFTPSTRMVFVNVPVPGLAATASAATATTNGTAAVAFAAIAPAYCTEKPVMRCPPVSAGVAGQASVDEIVTGAGTAPPSTNQVIVALVAPVGQADPVAENPAKVTFGPSSALVVGWVTVMVVSGPLEVLRPVRVTRLDVPAAMRVPVKLVLALTEEVRAPIE
jgi:hypothetical protein